MKPGPLGGESQTEDTVHPVFAFAAEKLVRPPNGKTTSVDRGGRDSWERTIHLDGRPVDRYTIGSGKLARPHRLLNGAKGSSSPLVEEAVGKDRQRLHFCLCLHVCVQPAFVITPFSFLVLFESLLHSTPIFSTSQANSWNPVCPVVVTCVQLAVNTVAGAATVC